MRSSLLSTHHHQDFLKWGQQVNAMNLYSDIIQRSQPCYTRSPNTLAEEALNPEAFCTLIESYTGITRVATSAYVAITQICVLIPAVCFYFTWEKGGHCADQQQVAAGTTSSRTTVLPNTTP